MKVAIVGCGGIGKAHARAYKMLPGTEILYMIDRVESLARETAAEFGAKPLCDIREMQERPDIVSVVTPPFAHTETTLSLIRMGIPVFCEKPLTMNAEEARAVVNASDKLGVPVGIGFKMRYEPVFQKARERIGSLGKLYGVSVVKNQPHNPNPNHWVRKVGCMYELSVHEYDLVNWIAGIRPESVRAELCYDFGWERENRAFLDVNYSGGVKGQLISCYSPATKFTFNDLTITYVGERGYMRVERPNRIFLHTDTDEIIDVVPKENGELFREELEAFVEAVRLGAKPDPDVRTGAEMTFLVEAARLSSERKERIRIEGV